MGDDTPGTYPERWTMASGLCQRQRGSGQAMAVRVGGVDEGQRERGRGQGMAVSVGGLDQRQMERLRVELVESIAATLAYPSFFDFHRGQAVARPVDRAKQEEIEQFVASVNFTSLERVDITS